MWLDKAENMNEDEISTEKSGMFFIYLFIFIGKIWHVDVVDGWIRLFFNSFG